MDQVSRWLLSVQYPLFGELPTSTHHNSVEQGAGLKHCFHGFQRLLKTFRQARHVGSGNYPSIGVLQYYLGLMTLPGQNKEWGSVAIALLYRWFGLKAKQTNYLITSLKEYCNNPLHISWRLSGFDIFIIKIPPFAHVSDVRRVVPPSRIRIFGLVMDHRNGVEWGACFADYRTNQINWPKIISWSPGGAIFLVSMRIPPS